MNSITRGIAGLFSLIAAISGLLGVSAAAQAADSPPLVLEHLTTSDGLPQATVMTTLQDSQGFVWLGTEDGLVRYDGREVFRYAYSPRVHDGLPGNFIYDFVEDSHHDLWVATKGSGLARWNRSKDNFTVYRHDSANSASLASDSVRAVLVDAHGLVWIGTGDAGVDILDPASGVIRHLRHDPAVPASLIDDRVQTLQLDRAGVLWVGTANGLDRWQADRRAFTHFQHIAGNPHTLSGNRVSRILEDRSGAFWIATDDGGVDRMERDGRVFQVFQHDPRQPDSLADNDVRAVLEDQAGHLWIGTPEGLDLLDRSTGHISHYQRDATDGQSLRDSFIMSLYEDGTGLVWIGTRSGGVSRWNPRSWELGGRRPDWLADKLVTSFADAPDNKVWVGSLGGGLSLFDPDKATATSIDDIVGRHNSIGDQRVMSLRRDHRGTLWIGTMSEGVKKLDPDGRLESIPVKPGDPRSLSAPGIMTIFEDSGGQIWIGTHGGGANVVDTATGRIRQLPYGDSKPGAISSANVSAIVEDRSGDLWIGTEGNGLDLARPDGTVVKVFRHDPNDPTTLPANTVYALTVDAQGRVWVATDGGGLALLVGSVESPGAIRFQSVTHEQGLSSDTIYGVLADTSGRIWLSGYTGLMRYDPDTRTVKTYHREHGLQGEEFDSGAYFRLRDGRLCFGGPGGFNIFDPSRLTESRLPPRIALTRIEIMGVPAKAATPSWLLKRISLDYRADILSLDFGALDFTSPKLNRIAYRMTGLTDRWIDLGTQHRVTLTNLDSGDHLLEVRAANSDSVWSLEPLRLTVHRDPAPWRSPWAYTVYALFALGLIAYRMRLHRIKFQRVVREQQRLESEVALRTRELVESNRRLEEASRAKGDFMDRMSHELRTPMNGVVGMTELLGRTTLTATQARLTSTIRSSAQVLLRIVNDLLDLSKINAGKVQLEQLPLDLPLILEESTRLFAGAADAKSIDLIVRPPPLEGLSLIGDPLRLRQILMNLVGNAVKFTTRGAIVVKADLTDVESQTAVLQLSVTDSGIGMDAATIGKIFTPFTQADESTTRRYGGTGLGLAICRELAELMGGSIRVESQPQVGSTFYVSLPVKLAAQTSSLPCAEAGNVAVSEEQIGGHVLLVEDEPVNAAVAEGYLSALGCTCVWVKDGSEALARNAGERFDLILMDLNMPTLDGFATTALIRQSQAGGRKVPIVALSAHDAVSYREKCLNAGMDDILGKPCTFEECAQVLRRWIRPASVSRIVTATGHLSKVDGAAVARLRKMRGGGQGDLFAKLVELFQSGSTDGMSQLRTALEAGDLQAAGAVGHKLASSAANVGALVFAKDMRHLEQVCADGDITQARVLFEPLWIAHPALIEELRGLLMRATA